LTPARREATPASPAPTPAAQPASPVPTPVARTSAAIPAPTQVDGIDYIEGDKLTLIYDGEKCIHARFCVTWGPKVFLANVKGPWIAPDAMDAEAQRAAGCVIGRDYPGPVVDHAVQRDKALTLYQLAVPVYQRLGSPSGLAECYHNMAITYRDASALEQADECERRAIEFAHHAGSRRLTALARLGRAEISLRRGEVSLAEVGASHAASAFRDAADPVGEGDALRLIGVARTLQGKLDLARSALETALSLTREHGAALNEAETLRALAEWAAAEGNHDVARVHASGAVTLLERLGATEDAAAMQLWIKENLLEENH